MAIEIPHCYVSGTAHLSALTPHGRCARRCRSTIALTCFGGARRMQLPRRIPRSQRSIARCRRNDTAAVRFVPRWGAHFTPIVLLTVKSFARRKFLPTKLLSCQRFQNPKIQAPNPKQAPNSKSKGPKLGFFPAIQSMCLPLACFGPSNLSFRICLVLGIWNLGFSFGCGRARRGSARFLRVPVDTRSDPAVFFT